MFKSIEINKKIIKYVLYLFIILLFLCSFRINSNIFIEKEYIRKLKKDYPQLSYYIDKAAKMNKKERKGVLLMVGIKDKVLSKKTIKTLKDNNIMGVILFDYNIENESQLKKLTSDLRKYVNSNMLISIDQEGGEVVRIKFDPLKDISPKIIGDKASKEYAYNIAYKKSKFLLDLGINMILGPLCDIPSNTNSYLYNRSFSDNINIVSDMAEYTVKAQKDAGIISVLKHFPGHGDTIVNSHNNFPVINKTTNELMMKEFIPFKKAIDAGAEMVLMAHIKNKYIDSKMPASMSQEYAYILEKYLGFNGVVITDDLAMTGSINFGINFGINLISNLYENTEYMFEDMDADILSCAKVLKIASENILSGT